MLFLKSLLQNRDSRYVTVIVALGILVIFAGMRIRELDAVIAARPKTESSEEKKVYSELERDPTVIDETITAKPDGTTVTERKTVKGAVKVSRGSEMSKERSQEPVGPGSSKSRRVLWAYEPMSAQHSVGLGMTFLGTWDVSLSNPVFPKPAFNPRGELAWRF